MTTTTTTATAYVTTAGNPLGADPGLTVRACDYGTAHVTDLLDLDTDLSAADMYDEDEHMPDFAAAGYLLLSHGYATDGDWVRSDGQWAVRVVRMCTVIQDEDDGVIRGEDE